MLIQHQTDYQIALAELESIIGAPVSQVSKPAVSPTSKSADPKHSKEQT